MCGAHIFVEMALCAVVRSMMLITNYAAKMDG